MKGQREMSQGHLNVDLNNQYSHMLCVVSLEMSFYLCFLKSTHTRICVLGVGVEEVTYDGQRYQPGGVNDFYPLSFSKIGDKH